MSSKKFDWFIKYWNHVDDIKVNMLIFSVVDCGFEPSLNKNCSLSQMLEGSWIGV